MRRIGYLLAAVLATALVTLLGSAQARPTANLWAGRWGSNFGTMVLTQSGSRVTGTYSHDSGRIVGTASGRVLSGTWNEAPTRAGPRDAGSFRFEMSADLRTFSGPWRYADGSEGGVWTGTRVGPPPGTTTVPADTSPPQVKALAPKGTVKPATRVKLQFTVSDDSGHAKVYAALYDGGKKVRSAAGSGTAKGQKVTWNTLLAADLKGPLFFCAWAEDAAGNKSAGAPKSSCAWLSFLVDINRVSNGCGGGDWDVLVWVQNYFGNTHTYKDSNINPLAKSYTVNFEAACNLHDAGYGGRTVRDTLRGGKKGIVRDFRTWTRKKVDKKFLGDMRLLCIQQIPAEATTALTNCKALGVKSFGSFGALTLYSFVRSQGFRFFDADLTKPGIQRTGHRDNS